MRRGLPGADLAAGTSLVDALVAVGLVDSRNAARRTIGEGGASLNNAKLTDPDQVLEEADFLAGRVALLKRGRRRPGRGAAGLSGSNWSRSGRIPLWHNGIRPAGEGGFVFLGEAGLMFSSSARREERTPRRSERSHREAGRSRGWQAVRSGPVDPVGFGEQEPLAPSGSARTP